MSSSRQKQQRIESVDGDETSLGAAHGIVRRNPTVIALLITQLFLIGWMAYRDSVTWDEVGHFAAGLRHWRDKTFDLYVVNPPLARLVACGPVLLLRPSMTGIPRGGGFPAWHRAEFICGTKVAKENGERYFWLITVSRWGCLPIVLLGGLVCFAWASELYGRSAATLALALWTFSPTVLAHGHLITPDAAAASLGVTASYCFHKWLNQQSWRRAVASGLTLGLAELTKGTWIILFLLWPILWLVWRTWRRAHAWSWSWSFAQLTCIALLAIWIINLGYGFEGSFKRLREYKFVSASFSGVKDKDEITGNRFAGTVAGWIPVPLPENYVSGIDVQKRDFESKMLSYLRGEWRQGGWWWYYVYAMLIKEPVGTWLLGVLAIGATVFCRRLYLVSWQDELMLLAPAIAVLVLVSSQTGFNHHLRYVLPAFPFLFIWMSKIARSFQLGHRWIAVAVLVAMTWATASSLSIFPHSLSYFNELVGGPKNGHWHLGNSNTDWGQDLLNLKRWLDQHPQAKQLQLVYDLPLIDPTLAGIEYLTPPIGPTALDAKKYGPVQLGPKNGWYAVSVNHLHRTDHAYDYFREFAPTAMAGYSIYIYHITTEQANSVRVKLGLPALENEFGSGNAHQKGPP
jgi:hypothetical protein